MPKAIGTLGNCYRVKINGLVHGFFASEIKAANYIRWYSQRYDVWAEPVIELWFIEGEL